MACSDPAPPGDGSTSTGSTSDGSADDSTSEPTTITTTVGLDSTGGDLGPGVCAAQCRTAAECVPPEELETDWACTDGFCERLALPPCDPLTCQLMSMGIGVCSRVDDVEQCTIPCPMAIECPPTLPLCVTTDDLGTPICTPLPCSGVSEGEPCVAPDGGTLGTCIAGECTCRVDEECTAAGFACSH